MLARRSALLIVLMLVALAGSLLAAPPADACEDGCPCDDAAGHCLPGCATCACCPAPRTLQSVAAGVEPDLDAAGDAEARPAATACGGDPREIFHVPKRAC